MCTCTVQDSHSIEIDVTLNQDTTVKEIQNYLHKINVLFFVNKSSKMKISILLKGAALNAVLELSTPHNFEKSKDKCIDTHLKKALV